MLAENLPTETYLDTGNRGLFENAAEPLLLHPDFDNWQRRRVAGSCRPFIDNVAVVELIWHRLAARAASLGLELPVAPETTTDSDLRVVAGNHRIAPITTSPRCYVFVLPVTGPVRLVSRAARPCDIRPWVEDHRRLGVMVSRLSLMHGTEVEPIPLDHPQLSDGWWDVEGDLAVRATAPPPPVPLPQEKGESRRRSACVWRWTNGNALVPLSGDGPVMLEVTIAGTIDYPFSSVPTARASRPTRLVWRGTGNHSSQRGIRFWQALGSRT